MGRDRDLNAWVFVAADAALDAARASETRWAKGEPAGPLDGVPVGVKDLLAVAGMPMRRGSEAFAADFVPAEDAPIVARLREAGAIFMGKTATPDSGCKLDTTSLVHGITRNPVNAARTAGGSSGGSAVAVACGHVPLAVGTDGAGSIRVPAAFCAIPGFKPGTGRIPAPVGPFWPHAVTGPMAGSVEDTALAWNICTRPDARDPYAAPFDPATDWVRVARDGARGLRVAVAESFWGVQAAPEIAAAVRAAAAALSDAGAAVSVAEPDWGCDVHGIFSVFWRCMYAQSVALMPAEQAARIDPLIADIVAGAVSQADYFAALAGRDRLALTMSLFHERFDILLCPVMPCQPWEAGLPGPGGRADWEWCPFTYPFNMTRQPAASVPAGVDADGLPLAVQVVAWRDSAVFRAAAVLEAGFSGARAGGLKGG